MASPFPGMDPFLESPAHWPDFHSTFINYWREALADLLPEHYSARIGERVYLVGGTPPDQEANGGTRETCRLITPDVALERQTGTVAPEPAKAAGVATLEPVTIPLLLLEEERETCIEILHRPDRSLVAVLELLSPANKEEPGRGMYLAKRHGLLHEDVHLVELDLLIGGRRLPLRDPLPEGHYFALISRANRRPNCDVYHWRLPQALPTLPIPLRAPDLDVFIDLQAVFATVYERGRYGREVDYTARPPVHVAEDVRTWIAERVRARQA
jgi:Protein of unknown function (DUF4058)